jgi:hypothetical protein
MKPDILIPYQFEERWKERTRPALEALGVPKTASLEKVLGAIGEARVWPLAIRRPKPGSTIIARRNGRNMRHGDLRVNLVGPDVEAREVPVRVTSVYGMTLLASIADSVIQEQVDWEECELMVISTDFVTLVADILPGKDSFVIVEMWPTVLLPLSILVQQDHSYVSTVSLNGFRWLNQGQVELLIQCPNCVGDGRVDCEKCKGTGTWQPDGSCKKCGGSGTVTCRRCSGSGDYIGKYGDRMGDCSSCSGDGKLTCNRCEGSGEPPILSCNPCEGTGKWLCKECSGDGVIDVRFWPIFGQYRFREELVRPNNVSGRDAKVNADYSFSQGARVLLKRLVDEYGTHLARQKEIQKVQAEIAKISDCLDRAMEAEGITEEIANFRPLPLGIPKPTTDRTKQRLILAFPLLKQPAWARSGECPLPQNTPVKFVDNGGQAEIELPRIPGKSLGKMAAAVFVRMEIVENYPHFLISLPDDIDLGKLSDKLFVKPDVPPPAELAQKKELARWCSHDRAPELIETIAIASKKSLVPPKVSTNNSRINPSQQKSLDWIMAGVPLVLIKGPPGTGKTTVITEAVLQSIKRNEKVLVCSETHQAVENVLERLHQDGRIRMIRHGRADQKQLSALGRDYLEDSSKQGFVRGVIDRVSKYVAARESEISALEPLLSQSCEALSAATQLATDRQRLSAREQKALGKCDNAIQAAQTKAEVACQAAIQEVDPVLKDLAIEAKRLESNLNKTKEKLKIFKDNRDGAREHFLRKTGKEPDPNFKGSASTLRKLASLGWNKLASPEHLNEQFAVAVAAMKHAKEEIKGLQDLGASNSLEKDRSCKKRDEKIARARAQAEEKSRNAQTDLDTILQGISLDLKEAESQFLPAQQNAVKSSAAVGIFSAWQADAAPEVWDERINECSNRISRNQEGLDFSNRWKSAAVNGGSALSALFWDTAQVFLSTCVGLASWRSFTRHFGDEGVDLVIIDEAAHATLTQSLIPMGRAKRAVLIGDEMQLPPAAPMGLSDRCEHSCAACDTSASSVSCRPAFKPEMSSCWLERSAFEWISETRPWIPKVMLNRQFRMHPDIANFVGRVFYEDGLENGVSAADRQLAFGPFNKAVCLIPTSAYKDRFEDKAHGATSYSNSLEANLTKRILNQASRHLETDTSFGVLTPYSAQKELMLRELSEFFGGSGHLKFQSEDVASVDSFQGSERDVMIASFVRSPTQAPRKCKTCNGTGMEANMECCKCDGTGWIGAKLNWVHDLRRLNVAFSRARKMLILVGDIQALTDPKIGTKKGTDVLSRFRQYIMKSGQVLHVWEEETL